jgi:hypothetical protein
MSKHTPGPWGYFCHHPEGSWHIGASPTTYAKGDPTIANLGQIGDQGANARLIAAAPELLEALEAMLSHTADLDPMQGYRPEEDFSAVKQARAAIAKAEGK